MSMCNEQTKNSNNLCSAKMLSNTNADLDLYNRVIRYRVQCALNSCHSVVILNSAFLNFARKNSNY